MDRAFLEAYSEAKAVLMATIPFIGSLLNKARVVVTEAVPTAAVDAKNSIVINPRFFLSLQKEDRAFVLAHEAMHWAFLDHIRVGNRDRKAWNIVTDGVNNHVLLSTMRPSREFGKGIVTLDTLAILTNRDTYTLKNMTKEQIYDLLPKFQSESSDDSGDSGEGESGNCESVGQNDPIGDDLSNENFSGETIQEGSDEIYNAADAEELKEAMKRVIAQAEALQKAKGSMPAGLQRMVDEILRPKVPWKTLLKQSLRSGLGKTSIATWQRPNRKRVDAMGRRRITVPTVWVGIDTSGSISRDELAQFVSEVYGIAKKFRAKVVVIPWDAEVYDPITITGPGQIRRVIENLRGGGGTNPRPFLKYVRERMNNLDAVVIMSDGYIGPPEGYLDDVRPVTAKASVAVFVTTGADVRWPGWKLIHIE